MAHCEYMLAKASSEEELEKAVHEAGQDGWYRSSPNRTSGELPVDALHYCVLSRIQPAIPRGKGFSHSFLAAKQHAFWGN